MYKKSAPYYDAIYHFKNYQQEAEKIHAFIRQHKKSPGKNLLDVACGTGNHITHLKQHYNIEGLDHNQYMLRIARKKHPDIIFHHADMTSFQLSKKYDIIICLFSSIGYVKTKQRLHQAIKNMAHHLAPGGILVIEPWFSPEAFTPGTLHGQFVDRPDLKIARMNISTVHDNLSIMNMHHLVGTPNGIEHFIETHEMGLFTRDEYQDALRIANLQPTYDPEGLTGRGLHVGIWQSG